MAPAESKVCPDEENNSVIVETTKVVGTNTTHSTLGSKAYVKAVSTCCCSPIGEKTYSHVHTSIGNPNEKMVISHVDRGSPISNLATAYDSINSPCISRGKENF